MTLPYTYLIGWSSKNVWYYGVRYAKGCHPNDLMNTYFTSSKLVESYIKNDGIPDVVQIRKTFNDQKDARAWEHKVLRRIKAIHREDFINKTDNISFEPKFGIKRPGIGGVKRGTKSPIKGKSAFHNPMTMKLIYLCENDSVPQGFIKGGLPKSKEHIMKNSLANKGKKRHSKEQKLKWSKERSGKNTYGNNPKAKKVVIEGIEYNSIRQACECLNKSKHYIYHYIKNGHFKNNQKTCEYCGIKTNLGNYYRWHGQKCKDFE